VNLEGALTWAFEFEDQPFFAGFRVLATNGIDLPVLNVFRMFSKMSGQRISSESSGAVSLDAILKDGVRANPDVGALASIDGKKLCILAWHYHDDDVPGPDATVEIALENLPFANGTAQLQHFRIDAEHSNSYEAWKKLGSPQQPTQEQYAQLERTGRLEALPLAQPLVVREGKATIQFTLPRQGVSLLSAQF
jgi:xylan 1,4-beta-xylosidase